MMHQEPVRANTAWSSVLIEDCDRWLCGCCGAQLKDIVACPCPHSWVEASAQVTRVYKTRSNPRQSTDGCTVTEARTTPQLAAVEPVYL
ncbi:hypothetical protein J6590_071842 [Homalodisca vitripennis]|nr:hypothetical protein J6590_071842 [Homalodisca vitripennis]